jgi:hypothetical protein
MAAEDEGFFSRWSRRKQAVRTGEPAAPEPERSALAPAVPVAVVPPPVTAPAEPVAEEAAPPPPPTLEDAARLTPEDDFRRFVAPDVPNDVRNAAVKKLFADPHFNVMDGLDTYIDDYSQPSPLSKAELAMMVGAQFLKLVDDPEELAAAKRQSASENAPAAEEHRVEEPSPGATAEAPNEVAQAADTTEAHDEHPDLQLQPDDVPGPEGPGRGTG